MFTDWLKQFVTEQSMRGAIARKVMERVGEGRKVESLPDLIIWVGPTICPVTQIGGYFVSEDNLRQVWKDFVTNP